MFVTRHIPMTIRNNHNLIFQSFCLVYGLYFECILVFLNCNAFLAHCSFPIVEKEPEVVTLLAAIGHQLVAKCHYKGILCIYIEVFDKAKNEVDKRNGAFVVVFQAVYVVNLGKVFQPIARYCVFLVIYISQKINNLLDFRGAFEGKGIERTRIVFVCLVS